MVEFAALYRVGTPGPSAPPATFDPSLYPRAYPASVGKRLLWISLGALLSIGGLCGVWYFGTGHETRGIRDALIMISVSLLFVLAGGYLILLMIRSLVILEPDAITVRTIVSTRKLLRDEIEGRRLLPGYISTLELIPRDKGKKKLSIGMLMRTDALFHAWFSGIPDLDAQELARFEAQITADPEIALTPKQGLERLMQARKVAGAFSAIATAASFWGWFFPRPYEVVVAILIALPIAAALLVARSKGLYGIDQFRNDARAGLGVPFILPGLVLTLRAASDIQLLAWMPALVWVLLGAVAITLVVVRVERGIRNRRWALHAFFLLGAAYTYGAIAQVNVLLDRSTPERFEVTVLSKHVSGNKNPTWKLEVGQWGPRRGNSNVSVSRRAKKPKISAIFCESDFASRAYPRSARRHAGAAPGTIRENRPAGPEHVRLP